MESVNKGFTLIEVLIAMAIFAILSVMTFQALQQTLTIQERVEEQAQELAEFQIVWTVLLRDIMNLARRPITTGFGEVEAAFVTDDGECPLIFTRGGLQTGFLFSQTGMQRVAYCLGGDDELYRVVWAVLDRPHDAEPQRSLLLNGVKKFEVEADDPETSCIDSSAKEALPIGSIIITIATRKGEVSRHFIGADTC